MPRHLRIDRRKMAQIFRIGLPAGAQNLLFSISNVLIQSAINSFGSPWSLPIPRGKHRGLCRNKHECLLQRSHHLHRTEHGREKVERIDAIAKVCTSLILVTWLSWAVLCSCSATAF
jgi:hypothetical protein